MEKTENLFKVKNTNLSTYLKLYFEFVSYIYQIINFNFRTYT